MYFLKGTSGDKFEFKAPRRGIYKFCFHNPLTTPETVAFYLHVGHIPETNDVAINGISLYLMFTLLLPFCISPLHALSSASCSSIVTLFVDD